jgi:transcription elongation factor GreA-like protein
MFTKLLAFIVLFSTLYVIGVFLFPELYDTYGNKTWNSHIRTIKEVLEKDHLETMTGETLIEKIRNNVNPYIEKTQEGIGHIESTIETKVEQTKQAIESIE